MKYYITIRNTSLGKSPNKFRLVLHEKRMCKQEIYSSSYPLVITLSQSFLSLVYNCPRPVVLPLSATKHARVGVGFDGEATVYGWLHNCMSQPVMIWLAFPTESALLSMRSIDRTSE